MFAAGWLVLALAVSACGGAERGCARVVLAWHVPPGAAAAALLRRALLAAGHACVRLEHRPRADSACSVLATPREPAHTLVALAVPLGPAWCSLSSSESSLRALAVGAARLSPRLLARLAPAAPAHCSTRLLAGTLPPHPTLRHCLFDNEGDVVLVASGEWDAAHAALASAGLRVRDVTRSELAALLDATAPSRLYVDALWDDYSLELPLRLQHDVSSLLLADEAELMRRHPALYHLLADESFQPEPRDLLAVLRHPFARTDPPDYEAAADATDAAGFHNWTEVLKMGRRRQAVVVLCDDDSPYLYAAAEGAVAQYTVRQSKQLAERTGAPYSFVVIKAMRVNCSEPAALEDVILQLHSSGESWSTVGVAAPAELAEVAALQVARVHLPLLAYSAGAAGVRASTGDTELQARALLRLLGDCEWQRVALLVEDSVPAQRLARAVLAAAGPQLAPRRARAREPDAAVREMAAQDSRVFLVLARARGAWRVLRAGHAQGLVAAHGYAWLLSELEVPDEPAAAAMLAALAPVSVSCQYRGSSEVEGELHARLLQEVAPPWPARLATLADALTTLVLGHARLVALYNSREHHDNPDKLRNFWKEVERAPVPGVAGNLSYDSGGVTNAPVYVERWLNATPARLAVWRAGDARGACPLRAPPADGRARCWWPHADRFEQACRDAALAGALLALAAGAALLAAGRRWLRRRDTRLQREATVRVLAQREATFAALVPHLVEPAALKLGGELGAGRYGRVRLAELRAPRRRPALVAVKALRESATPAEESEFLREARTLAALRHERVVRFEGVCWDGGAPLLLMEYAFFGDLVHYLRARRHLAIGPASAAGGEAEHVTARALTQLAREAAEALAYLATCRLVHRDVRAANCLVDARRSLKLADFGLARHTGTTDDEYVCRGCALFPVLWMAPESLRGVASSASDTWAFGVLALELVTLGARPWGAAPPWAVVRAVLAGARPPLPRAASAETRALATACWRRTPTRRPSAARLVRWLARRPRALLPAMPADPLELDCDSGIGEPDRDPLAPDPRPSP